MLLFQILCKLGVFVVLTPDERRETDAVRDAASDAARDAASWAAAFYLTEAQAVTFRYNMLLSIARKLKPSRCVCLSVCLSVCVCLSVRLRKVEVQKCA